MSLRFETLLFMITFLHLLSAISMYKMGEKETFLKKIANVELIDALINFKVIPYMKIQFHAKVHQTREASRVVHYLLNID